MEEKGKIPGCYPDGIYVEIDNNVEAPGDIGYPNMGHKLSSVAEWQGGKPVRVMVYKPIGEVIVTPSEPSLEPVK